MCMTKQETNKIKAKQTNLQPETLTDLPLADRHAEETKGGTGEVQSFLAFPGFTGGVRVAAGDVD